MTPIDGLRTVPAHNSITVTIDPRLWWSVKNHKGDCVPISDPERRNFSCRLEYRPPPPAILAGLASPLSDDGFCVSSDLTDPTDLTISSMVMVRVKNLVFLTCPRYLSVS